MLLLDCPTPDTWVNAVELAEVLIFFLVLIIGGGGALIYAMMRDL